MASWYGCSIYDASLLVPSPPDASTSDAAPTVDARATEAGTDSQAHDGGEAGPNPCPEVFPPAAPAADDPSDAGDQTFVVAVHSIDFGLGDAGPSSLGYDLDRVFTCCDGGPESCTAAVTGATHCDSPEGRDNSAGELLTALSSIDSTEFNIGVVNQLIAAGSYSILLQVQHYNGQPNDTQVTASMFTSDGVERDASAEWEGGDLWTLDRGFVLDPDAGTILPNHFDANAFVSDGTLVIHVDFPLSLDTSSNERFTITLTSGMVTASVVPVGNGTYRLTDGQFTGRWNITQMLSSIQTLTLQGAPICPNTASYAFVKQQICTYADIMTDQSKDRTGTTCDALSIGFGYSADPALMGYVVAGLAKTGACPADAAPDDCTNP